MGMVVLGVLLVVLKLAGVGWVAAWSWWWVLSPFALAAAWWQIADSTGLTRRAAMRRDDERTARRRDEQFAALGLSRPSQRATKKSASDQPPP